MIHSQEKNPPKRKKPGASVSIDLPGYSAGSRPSSLTALRGIIKSDQFDDWLPDPVYYEDQRQSEKAAAERIDKLFQAGKLKTPASENVNLPRYSGKPLKAMAFPLDARVCAHIVISAMAPLITKALLKEKVYGFEFKDGEFARPGDGLVEAFNNSIEGALFSSRRSLEILDVRDFNNTASFLRLEQILQKIGARSDETGFLQQLFRSDAASFPTAAVGNLTGLGSDRVTTGLPSVDDAFAFLYNFYLQPVDEALRQSKLNFTRYRDEYFVFDESTSKRVYTALKQAGLDSRVVASYRNFDIKDKLSEQISGDRKQVSEILGSFGGGEIVATYECDTWNEKEKSCVSDSYEVKFKLKEDVTDLFRLQNDKPLDCIQILPLLRSINRQRAPHVLRRPPKFEGASEEFLGYRKALNTGRVSFLDRALNIAVQSRVDWQIIWVASLLSDLDMLFDDEAKLLQKAIVDPLVGKAAKAQARLALARCSSLAPEQYWADPSTSYSDYQLRTSMLAARYLLDRGFDKPWLTMRSLAQSREPELTGFLFSGR